MFFILRNKHSGDLMHRDAEAGHCATTNDLQKAKLFWMELIVDSLVLETQKATTGEITMTFKPKVPEGLDGDWEVVPVDLQLAG